MNAGRCYWTKTEKRLSGGSVAHVRHVPAQPETWRRQISNEISILKKNVVRIQSSRASVTWGRMGRWN
jgi:hypothetical protein